MPLYAIGWTTEEDENLVQLVKPHSHLYNLLDPSRKNILGRESTWQEIAKVLMKPVEECKKRWRGLRDSYMRSKRMGAMHKTKISLFENLQFLDSVPNECSANDTSEMVIKTVTPEAPNMEGRDMIEEEVITDNGEYYEITLIDGPKQTQENQTFIKLLPKTDIKLEPPKKIGRKTAGRKKSVPLPRNITPIKILPKPIMTNQPKLISYVEEPKTPEQRSQTIDKLIERMLKENTNEIDVFFRSMAASVKKLKPSLIPKVKMEVCNVIAKYEMQSFEKNNQD
ncbi:uncharacterized protein LOC126967101 [Leptidea sinapis]|uniref:MADF domain-containing protein n=1 Tax=Leptidea sinapis TaxID=189913 RepID=A0A5E4QCX8_9NEOP|nr:uncharacterized protein LOC126967101 [Leptidea sinapis]VVC95313.1 unnamed protein product [Leptidea sinapis]